MENSKNQKDILKLSDLYGTGSLFSLVFSIFLGRNFLFDQEIERVDWAEPEHEVDPDVMAKVKVLFIRNLTVNTTEDDISAAFEEASEGQIERVSKIRKIIHDRKLNSLCVAQYRLIFLRSYQP